MDLHHWTCTLLALVAAVSTYNLDVSRAKIFSDPNAASSRRSSYFGYSVALYVHQNVSLLLVGAPRANSSRRADKNDRVFEPGAVYRCDLSSQANNCTEWLFDNITSNNKGKKGIQQIKNRAWIGATVVVENSTSPRVAICAPLWKTRYSFTETKHYDSTGMCYSETTNKGVLKTTAYYPNSYFEVDGTKDSYFKNFNLDEAGFSAHIEPDTHRLMTGAPGVSKWNGSMISLEDDRYINQQEKFPTTKIVRNFGLKMGYFGYSITSGNFYKEKKRFYATGAPRSNNLRGTVFIFDTLRSIGEDFLDMIEEFGGENFGEYFGSSLTACDVNGDGRDDLIVGAPLWTHNIDEGRVYAYISKGQSNWKTYIINGTRPSGRFGSSLACLGDLDHDGFQDVAVGAPYEDEGQGAVYVYSGSGDRELFLKPSQRIVANNLLPLTPTLRGFGYSLSEPVRDVDGDGFPDLAVGAYVSGHAVFLPSSPVVRVNVVLQRYLNESLASNSMHFAFKACAEYHGHLVAFNATIFVRLYEVTGHGKKELNFGHTTRRAITLKPAEQHCEFIYILRENSIRYVENPIQVNMNLRCGHVDSTSSTRCFAMIHPQSKDSDSILAYARECGSDDTCQADLRVSIESNLSGPNNSYTIGSKQNVKVTISVINLEEPAYMPEAVISIPKPITMFRVPPNCKTSYQVNNDLVLTCQLPNPLLKESPGILHLELDMSAIECPEKYKEINVKVTTRSVEEKLNDNSKSLGITYDVEADLRIVGKSQEERYSYLDSDVDEMHSKDLIIHHIYEIYKLGPTPIQKAEFFVDVPVQFQNLVIANISSVHDSVAGHEFNCTLEVLSNHNSSNQKNLLDSFVSSQDVFSINCTNPDVICQSLRCDVGPFIETTSVAELIVHIDLQVSNDIVEAAKGKNIIYSSQGFVEIVVPNVQFVTNNTRQNFVQISTEISSYNHVGISIWIIVLPSTLLGLVIFVIMIFIFYKLGFFKRKRKDDLQSSKPTVEVN